MKLCANLDSADNAGTACSRILRESRLNSPFEACTDSLQILLLGEQQELTVNAMLTILIYAPIGSRGERDK